jgi:large subunit ribosomal protein L6
MSRIGRLPIPVPAGVSVTIDGRDITVKGPKGTLSHAVAGNITVSQEADTLSVVRADDERLSRSLHGLTRTLIANMVAGVTQGYEKKLQIVGTGYRVALKGQSLEFALGYSHSITVNPPEGISFSVENPTNLTVLGIDKQQVGEVAANLRKLRKPEPYKGKGVRYLGEQVKRKVGKAGKGGKGGKK